MQRVEGWGKGNKSEFSFELTAEQALSFRLVGPKLWTFPVPLLRFFSRFKGQRNSLHRDLPILIFSITFPEYNRTRSRNASLSFKFHLLIVLICFFIFPR